MWLYQTKKKQKCENLPRPEVTVTPVGKHSLCMKWCMCELPPSNYILSYYVVTLIGSEFTGEGPQSHSVYDCIMKYNGTKIPAKQHTWLLKRGCGENALSICGVCTKSVYEWEIFGFLLLLLISNLLSVKISAADILKPMKKLFYYAFPVIFEFLK